MSSYVGVDGCKQGWVAVRLDDDGFVEAVLEPSIGELLATWPDAVFGVDIPIGLASTGWRDADVAARAALRGRASTVFLTPPRPALTAPDYVAACAESRRLTGKAFSRQAWALRKKILEVDAFLGDARIHEVHPELSFQEMAGPRRWSKRTWGGHRERVEALEARGIHLPPDLGAASKAGADDVLDAAAAAWSARRIARGTARSWPATPKQRDGGRVIAIRA